MKRRTFFKTTAASGSLIALSGVAACTAEPAKEVKTDFSSFDLNEITVNELQQMMKSGKLTSTEICQKYLDRIDEVDSVLKSVIQLNPDALESALTELILDPEQRQHMGINGHDLASETFSHEAMIGNLMQMYRDTVGGPRVKEI